MSDADNENIDNYLKTIRKIIYFYYQWKNSEQYRLFIKEQQRINSFTSARYISIPTSIFNNKCMYEFSDLIGKFIEDQEQQLWTVADSTKSSSLLSKEFKFHTSNSY